MSICVSFQKLFDKATDPAFAGKLSSLDFFEVEEHSADSSPVPMTLLRVEKKDASFTSFSNSLVKGMKDITVTRSSHLLDCDCDGIAFELESDSVSEGIILAELKSRFCSQHLIKAYKQVVFSFLKMHAMLSICKDYSSDALAVHFIAACQCFENEEQEDTVYTFLSKAEKLSDSFEGVFLRKLIEARSIKIKIGDVLNLWNIPVSDSLMNKEVTMTLQLTKSYGDKSTVFSM